MAHAKDGSGSRLIVWPLQLSGPFRAHFLGVLSSKTQNTPVHMWPFFPTKRQIPPGRGAVNIAYCQGAIHPRS